MRVVIYDKAIDCKCVSNLIVDDVCPNCGEPLVDTATKTYISAFNRYLCVDVNTYACGTFAILLRRVTGDRSDNLIHESNRCKSNAVILGLSKTEEDVI